MSLSLTQFHKIPLSSKPIETPKDLQKIVVESHTRRKLGHYWSLDNRSGNMLSNYCVQILRRLKPGEVVYTKTTLSAWVMKQDGVQKEKQVVYQVYHRLWSGKVICRAIDKQEYGKGYFNPPLFVIKSSNFPLLYPSARPGTKIIQYFHETIAATSPHLLDPKSIEWRFQSLHMYDKTAIDFAVEQLNNKGFIVTVYPPYNVVLGQELVAVQAMGIRIPSLVELAPDSYVEPHPTYREFFSAHNTLVASRFGLYKYFTQTDTFVTIEWVVAEISKKLRVIASESPLVKRCAFPLPLSDLGIHFDALEKFQQLGYQATLDMFFIHQEHVNGVLCQFQTRNILIDLP